MSGVLIFFELKIIFLGQEMSILKNILIMTLLILYGSYPALVINRAVYNYQSSSFAQLASTRRKLTA